MNIPKPRTEEDRTKELEQVADEFVQGMPEMSKNKEADDLIKSIARQSFMAGYVMANTRVISLL